GAKCHQYADDTTFYKHCKPADLQSTVTDLSANVGKLEVWSREANLVINPSKTKVMLLSTSQLSNVHHLDVANIDIAVNGNPLERVTTTKTVRIPYSSTPELGRKCQARRIVLLCYSNNTEKTKEYPTFPHQKEFSTGTCPK
ncbi:hypothetical protein OS493_039857, partial [Desmophyllum pertusum]